MRQVPHDLQLRLRDGLVTASDIRPQGDQPPISLDALVALMVGGDAYVEVRTGDFPGGEIRGQLVQVSR